jgi:hypothetical protein
MRFFRRLTIVESITLAAIGAVLASLIFIPDSATSVRRSLEKRARSWVPGSIPPLPDSLVRSTDLTLTGEWVSRAHLTRSSFVFAPGNDDNYDAQFSTSGCLGGCKLSRSARLTEGVIKLNGAVAEYIPRTYDTLYGIRIGADDYLLPAVSVLAFERERAAGSNVWKHYVFSRAEVPAITTGPQ